MRTRLYGNIVLSGGSTLIPGFDTRLRREVQRRVDERIKNYQALSKIKVPEIKVKLEQNMV